MSIVVPYDPEWSNQFSTITRFIMDGLNHDVLGVEHVGSTSIPGMAAKPIIDIDIVINPGSFQVIKTDLIEIGYQHSGDKGLKGREAFKYIGDVLVFPHHLYVIEAGNYHLKKHLSFRDYLCERTDLIRDVSEYKLKVAKAANYDRKRYQQIKEGSEYIRQIADDAFNDPDFRSDYFD